MQLISAPVKTPLIITSPYGYRKFVDSNTHQTIEGFHEGIDFVSKSGDASVIAVSSGVVVYDQDDYDDSQRWTNMYHSAGNMLIIQHVIDDVPVFVRYLHIDKNIVSKGSPVIEGQVLGTYADVGRSYGAHLHVDVYDVNWKLIDPTNILSLTRMK